MKQDINKPSILRSILAAGVMTFIFAMTAYFGEEGTWWYKLSFSLMWVSMAIPAFLIAIKLPIIKQLYERIVIRIEAKRNARIKIKEDKYKEKHSKKQEKKLAKKQLKEDKKKYKDSQDTQISHNDENLS